MRPPVFVFLQDCITKPSGCAELCVCVCLCVAGLQPAEPSALRLLRSLSAAWNAEKMDPESQSYSQCKADLNDLNESVGFISLFKNVK